MLQPKRTSARGTFRSLIFSPFFLAPIANLDRLLLQLFIGSAVMQDGQAPGTYHPDRQDDDREDLEYAAPTDSETKARTASLNAGCKDKGGMYDSSLERFKDEWSDDDSVSKPGNSDADVHPEA